MTPGDWQALARVFRAGERSIDAPAPGMAVALEVKMALRAMATECEIIAKENENGQADSR